MDELKYKDGKFTVNGNKVENVIGLMPILSAQTYDLSDNPEWLSVTIDAENKIIEGIDKKGNKILGGSITSPTINKILSLIPSDEKIELLGSKSIWYGNTIWWCGTSIPAAGYWDVNNVESYPYLTCLFLGAKKVWNEAVGSSAANGKKNKSSYEVQGRKMGHSIADVFEILDDAYEVDDTAKTVRFKGSSQYVSDWTSEITYAQYQDIRYNMLSQSYEIKLVAKYLLSDKSEHDAFLREKFGDKYDVIISYANSTSQNFDYKGDVDLFVIDHGHNDGPSPVEQSQIASSDMTTFVGAINTYIRLIYQYRPHARIVFISDYEGENCCEAQKQISQYWKIPFLDLRLVSPIYSGEKVKTRGYWNNNGIWENEGFTYNPNETSIEKAFSVKGNAYFNSYLGKTVSEIAANITPEQDSNGVWWWHCNQRYMWMKDGLHPHSDRTNNCLKNYAQIIAEFLKGVGNGYI